MIGDGVADQSSAVEVQNRCQIEETAFTDGQNSVISPVSIVYAFAMARAGAAGGTAEQLDRVLGFPGSGLLQLPGGGS